MRNVLYIFVIACVISGCGNPYIDFYKQEISDSDLEALKKSHPDYFLPYNEFSINIYEINWDDAEINAAGAELESRGCIFLGFSNFYGVMEAKRNVVKAAKEIGATAALYTTKYRGKETGLRSVTDYSTTSGNISGSVSGNISGSVSNFSNYGYNSRNYTGNYFGNYFGNYSETTSYTYHVPYQYDTYYQFAAFFINCK